LSDSSVSIIDLHLEALEGLFAAVFLVTLGGWRHLDGLEQLGGGLTCVGDCSWPAPVIIL
jgi:hypothetical protein